ncbi:response regulator transcription factor [Pleionea sediminis]|uniref:response regulator transcription factor n=1 Tax=Pleionea sediminis TaxID=2569479 RepID=UPI0011871EEA|nr:response regulator transcription factor [Pleionea sediminis]
MSSHSKNRLYVTVDKLLYREALMYQLLLQPDFEIVGESNSGVETISQLPRSQASILLIEEDLRDNDGLTISEVLLERIPELSIVLLVDKKFSQQRLSIYLEAGIKSVVSKTQPIKDLITTLFYVQSGQVYIDAEQFREPNTDPILDHGKFLDLSEREQEVAKLIAQRVSIKDIADSLGVSNKTIHTYKERILVKMGFERIPELMLFMHRYTRNISL